MSFTWKNGRSLESFNNLSYNILYKYNADGIRVEKHITDKSTETTESHYYDYNGTQLICERWGDNTVWYLYDESGNPIGFTYNGTEYYYLKNVQGDITGISDANGNIVTEYTYDVWGKVLSVTGSKADTIGEINPIRYRGYYYDTETGFYLTGTRYYDPEIGRFINADGYVSTGQGILGTNMFAYCGNNPVNRYDPNGEAFLTATICGIAVWKFAAAITGALLVGATTYAVTDSLVRNPPVLPSISLPKITIKPKAKTKDTTKDITAPPPSNGTTYYHVTSAENAAAIMWNQPNTLVGSIWEGGYVYAWKMPPSKYAIENSGAHMGVTISFKTSASFVMDTGITDPKVQMYGPVVSTVPGPIVVWDVKIVG